MATLVMFEAKVQTASIPVLLELLRAALPDTRAFAGCQGLTAHVNQDDPQTFVFIEQWSSREAYQEYLAWRTANGTLAQLASLLDGQPSIRYFDAVDV